jgi:hypothetical protein
LKGVPLRPAIKRGDLVEVLNEEAIRATLDERGRLQGLAYMPEMRACSGRVFRVFRRADLICVEGVDGKRRMERTVLLENLRCDGSAHDACGRGCLILWKERWLRKLSRAEVRRWKKAGGEAALPAAPAMPPSCAGLHATNGHLYSCQSAHLLEATAPCKGSEPSQHLIDALNGNIPLAQVLGIALGVLGRRVKRLMRLQTPAGANAAADGPSTPAVGLQPGELVQIRSREEIQATLDERNRNRGLSFEDSMFHFCGARFRVLRRVDRIILETTGQMKPIRDTVVLQGGDCKFCPRANQLYWREAWLKRVQEPAGGKGSD